MLNPNDRRLNLLHVIKIKSEGFSSTLLWELILIDVFKANCTHKILSTVDENFGATRWISNLILMNSFNFFEFKISR